jgi:uncharacterized protein
MTMGRPVHFEILADDPEVVAAFYGQVFGWEIAASHGPQPYWLVTTGPQGTPGINGGITHRQLHQAVINTVQVESVEDTLAKIGAAGGKKVHGPHDIPGVGRHAYCSDPEGNLFGILQPCMAKA